MSINENYVPSNSNTDLENSSNVADNQKEPVEPDDNWDDDNEFIPCSKCDGHPACEDFGCAFELGCGHLVKNDENDL